MCRRSRDGRSVVVEEPGIFLRRATYKRIKLFVTRCKLKFPEMSRWSWDRRTVAEQEPHILLFRPSDKRIVFAPLRSDVMPCECRYVDGDRRYVWPR